MSAALAAAACGRPASAPGAAPTPGGTAAEPAASAPGAWAGVGGVRDSSAVRRAARRLIGSRVEVLVRAEIEEAQRRGAHHIGDLLRAFPTVSVRDLPELDWTERMLCVESRRRMMTPMSAMPCTPMMVVLDGVPVNGGMFLLLGLPLEQIESVEVLTPTRAMVAVGRIGPGGGRGALIVHTRGNGPYARR